MRFGGPNVNRNVLSDRYVNAPKNVELSFHNSDYGGCRQSLLEEGPAEVVRNLLPDYADGDLSSLCVWPDQIRHWYKYRWTSPLHFIDTPDKACTFDYSSKRRASSRH